MGSIADGILQAWRYIKSAEREESAVVTFFVPRQYGKRAIAVALGVRTLLKNPREPMFYGPNAANVREGIALILEEEGVLERAEFSESSVVLDIAPPQQREEREMPN